MAENFYELLARRNKLDPYFEKFNYENVGGSPILGVNVGCDNWSLCQTPMLSKISY